MENKLQASSGYFWVKWKDKFWLAKSFFSVHGPRYYELIEQKGGYNLINEEDVQQVEEIRLPTY